MKWKILAVALGALAGGGVGFFLRIRHGVCYLFDIHSLETPAYWVFLNSAPTYRYVLTGLGLGAAAGILIIYAWLGFRIYLWPRFQKAVGPLHLVAGGLAGLGGIIPGIIRYFLAPFERIFPEVIPACVLAGMAGAAILTTIVHFVGRAEKQPRVAWAIVGGIPCGYLAFIQAFELELPAPLCP